MNCPKCDVEIYMDHVDSQNRYWYTCMNPKCPSYRKAFQPLSGEEDEARLIRKEVVRDETPPAIDITDNAE